MRAGALRHRASLQASQKAPDGGGGFTEQWVELRKVWVEITLPTGRVADVSSQLQAVVTAEIRARPRADLVAGRRLVHGGVTYAIEAALPDNKRSLLRLLCSNVTPTPR
ncbi:phage head closure protein [Pseudomonas citronellolis]|uniref:Phage head closure protein n=1 Tax=Pseudomonas citronellolis TaxID=53408 RepID=A0AAW6P7B4_9PSED|nr:phage head closure protein [Pseudomonas citronellolis]MDF3842674.1 phage head closure protein [Pseudomonas citronellolis]